MPMEDPRDLGTNADGSRNEDYCRFCFQDGRFTDPDITVARMIEKCAGIMEEMGAPHEKIEQMRIFLPGLKRWSR
jgi:hypothetical protein